MKFGWRENEYACRNCGRAYSADRLDRRMWCTACRGEVIRRSSRIARIVAFVVTAALAAWVFYLVGTAPRFLMIYLVMIGAAYLFLFKLAQRVAFEVIRGRGVPPPEVDDDD